MDLYKEILLHILYKQDCKVEVTFPNLKFSAGEMIESAAYCALAEIQRILQDDELTDEDCFQKIEAIVYEFERLGSGCGDRHDWG